MRIRLGVELRDIDGFETHQERVRRILLGAGERLAVDGVVVAAGAWSGRLARQLGCAVPLEGQPGYHVTVANPQVNLNRTVMALEHNLMVNPMAMGLRLAGTVEFAGQKALPRYTPGAALCERLVRLSA